MYLFTISENKDNKKTENHKENLVEITNEYNEMDGLNTNLRVS